jgi:hypothetical protein
VSNKAANLKLSVTHAAFYFTAVGSFRSEAKAQKMGLYIATVRAYGRAEIRRTSRYTVEEMSACGKLLHEGDMDKFENIAYEKCADLVRSASERGEGPQSLFKQDRIGDKLILK